MRDDVAESSTRARWRMPNWFNVLWSNSKARIGLILLLMFFLVALLAPILAPYDPRDTSFMAAMQPSGEHLLGTTQAGQDVLSQLIWGARTSLLVGALAGGLATADRAGHRYDRRLHAGHRRRRAVLLHQSGAGDPDLAADDRAGRLRAGAGLSLTIVVIGITGWAWGARMKRAQVISLRAREYITSASFAGERPMRIIFREVMPNMMSFVVMSFIGAANGAIGAEAGLAFLGLGDPNTISWGTMLYWANNGGAMLTGQWAWLAAPTLMLSLITLSLTLINFGVDALSNPHLREE